MADKRTWTVPQEIIDLFNDWDALVAVSNAYVKTPFGYKKAVKARKAAERINTKAWGMLYKLYPEMSGGIRLSYDIGKVTED